ncbi:MAG: myo-inosose-2 dehydratase [Proteobacteria bacterium]|nr:myo-inosose-2 dehydratase [Pseudomonadota bacterium]
MTIEIGINPITWSNDDLLYLGGDTPLEVCLAEAREAGYAGIELGNKFPRQASVLAPIMKRHHLKLVSGWYSASLLKRSAKEEIAAMQPHLSLLQDMGCKVMVFAETSNDIHGDQSRPLSERPILKAGAWQQFGERMTAVGDYMEKQGLKLAYHHHMGGVVQSAEEVDKLMAVTGPSVGLLLDTGHAVFGGADPVAMAKRHINRIVHVHCKDIRKDIMARARKENMSFLNAVLNGVFTVPGDGMIDYDSVLSVLSAAGYDGWLVVEAEQDPAKAHPLTYAKMGYRGLRDAAIRTGLLSA